jgi:hypothetical protein
VDAKGTPLYLAIPTETNHSDGWINADNMLIISGTKLYGSNAHDAPPVISYALKSYRWKRLLSLAFIEVTSRALTPFAVDNVDGATRARQIFCFVIGDNFF